MAIQKQSIPINFSGGLDNKSDDKQSSPNNFLILNNSVFTTGGRLSKRNGYASFGTSVNTTFSNILYSNLTANISDARKVFSFNNELLVNDGFNLYSYDKSSNDWFFKGRSTMLSLATTPIAQDDISKSNMDCCIDTVSNVKIFVWYESNGGDFVRYSIQDLSTGQFLLNKAILIDSTTNTSYKTPRCVSIGGRSFIFAVNSSGGIDDGKIFQQTIVGKTVTGLATSFVTDLNFTYRYFDVDFISGNLYFLYFTGTPSIKIMQLNSSLAIVNSIAKAAEDASHGLSMFGDGTNIWVCYNNGTNTKTFIVNNAVTSTTLAPTIVAASAVAINVVGCWSSTLNKAFIFYEGTSGTDVNIKFNTMTVAGVAGTSAILMGSTVIVSKAFAVGGIPHLVTQFISTSNQNQYFLVNLYNYDPSNNPVIGNIACRIAPESGGGITPSLNRGWVCGIHNSSGSIWELALGQKTDISIAGAIGNDVPFPVLYSPIGVIDCQFDFSLTNPDVQVLGNCANIAAGTLLSYDGANIVEQNYYAYPEFFSFLAANAGGSMGNATSSTLYSYIFVYEWTDNSGQVNRSGPSETITTGTLTSPTFASGVVTGQVTLGVPPINVSAKNGVYVNIYRTTGNGSVFYLVKAQFGIVPNTPNNGALITYVDTTSDAALIANNQLYTTGELENFSVPSPRALSVFKNRLLSVPYEGGFNFGYSKQVLLDSPVEFSPSFDQNIGTVAGPLTTIAGMDDKIILFKSGKIVGPSILYMVGTGPAASGANNDFTDPLPVAVDVGCIDRASIVLIPSGLVFKSDKGIYHLDRNLQASYIGAAVEAYNQYSVVSSQLIPNTTQVRFLLSNGTTLMLDYYYNQWGTFTGVSGVSDCIFQGQHTIVAANGTVFQETPGIYVDGVSTPINMNFQTAWIKVAGLQGFERAYFFYLLGSYISPHTLTLGIAYDYNPAIVQTTVITPSPTDSIEQWRIFLDIQKCESFQINLQESYDSSIGPAAGAGLTLSGINLIIGAKSGYPRLQAGRQTG